AGGIGVGGVAKDSGGKVLVREAGEVGAVAGVGAAMIDGGQAFVFAVNQTGGVVERLAVIEFAAFEHLLKKSCVADARMIEIFVPEEQVFDGGVETCCGGGMG